jgi:hypothetical protein
LIANGDRLRASAVAIPDLPASRKASNRISSSTDHLELLFFGKVALGE